MMHSLCKRALVVGTVLAVPLAAQAQTNDSRYQSWAPPGSAAAQNDQQLESLLKELNALIQAGERDRAANRLFLRDLKDLAARYANPWTTRVLSDDFADGDFTRGTRWSVTSGEYWVEQGYGLRSRVTAAAANGGERKVSKEELAISILGAVLAGKEGAQVTTGPAADARPSAIETSARIPNAFSATVQLTSWKAEGQFAAAVTQGVGGAGYRVVYTAGAKPQLALVKVTSRGQGVIDRAAVAALEDQKVHSLKWTRAADGTMRVSVDGQDVLSARDLGFRDPFDGFQFTSQGADVIVKSVEVLGAR